MRSTASLVIAFVAALSLAVPAAATVDTQGRGRASGQAGKAGKAAKKEVKQEKKAEKSAKKSDKDVVVVDRAGHARVIREFRGTGSLPPGLAKRESLPPGLRRQLAERGELPPGLQKYLVEVPGPWVARLPAVPPHYHRYFAGDDLIVVDTRSNRIVAIVRDVLR